MKPLARVLLAICLFIPITWAAEDESKSIDQEVQDLKEAIIKLNRDLFVLEEELLFPATTQVAVFLSMDVGEFFQLDTVEVKIDDKPVSSYLYTDRQVKALHRGGVQRLYVGNIKTGKHELVAFFIGKGPKGREFKRGTTYTFEKTTDAQLLELKIVDSTAKFQPEFTVKEWE